MNNRNRNRNRHAKIKEKNSQGLTPRQRTAGRGECFSRRDKPLIT